MRLQLFGLSVLLLGACQPPVPDDRLGGVGFESYGSYQQRQIAAAQYAAQSPVQTLPGAVAPGSDLPGTGTPTAAELAQAGVSGAAGLAQQSPAYAAPIASVPPAVTGQTYAGQTYAGQTYASAAPAVVPSTAPQAHSGISDEQDFSAVSSRESIQSDKQRIEQNKAQYQQIQPTELPQRSGGVAGPALIDYALKAPNRKGESIYARSRLAITSTERACARYATPEAAQEAFLKSGGPRRDPKNLDPDGDGFACFWDPTPFQKARG